MIRRAIASARARPVFPSHAPAACSGLPAHVEFKKIDDSMRGRFTTRVNFRINKRVNDTSAVIRRAIASARASMTKFHATRVNFFGK